MTSLSVFKHVWSQQVKDLVIIGEGPLCNYLIETLKSRNLTYHHVTIPRSPTLTINGIQKQTKQTITFPTCDEQEIEYFSSFIDCSKEEVLIAQERLTKKKLTVTGNNYFNTREIYEYTLPESTDSNSNHRSYIQGIRKEGNLNFIKLENNITLTGYLVCFVDINDSRLAEEYLDLDNPIKMRLIKKECREETDNNVYVDLDDQKIIASGEEVITIKDVDAYYDKLTGKYKYENRDNMYPERIFFRPKSNTVLVLDPLNYPTSSPERDVLIVTDIVTKMLITN